MNSKEDKLFVKRNVNFNNTLYSDFEYKHNKPINAISHMNGDPWVGNVTRTAHEKVSEKRDEEAFHNQLKPLLILLRALGCFPVDFPKTEICSRFFFPISFGVKTSSSDTITITVLNIAYLFFSAFDNKVLRIKFVGKEEDEIEGWREMHSVPRYRSVSPALAYSICLYVAVNVSAFLNMRHHLLLLFKKDNHFSDSIYTCMLIIVLANCTCVPVLAWLDTPTVVQYFKKWEHFQMMFVKVTQKHLVLNIKRSTIHRIIVSCIVASSVFLLKFFPPYLPDWQLPCYCVCVFVISTTLTMFRGMFLGLFTAGTTLNKCFKREMKQSIRSAQLIGKYRILWLRWSQLVSQVGCVMGKVFGLYLLLMLLSITVSLYGVLSRLQKKQEQLLVELDAGGFCLFNILAVYYFCNCAHTFSNTVEVEIRDELQLIGPSEVGADVSQEVNMFLETILMNPPVVSVAGFANVDRGLFMSYASTIVTYMIVLVQFDQSDYSDAKCRGNETHHIT